MDRLYFNVRRWLVEHPAISHFEWKEGHTWCASPLFLTLTVLSYLSLTFLFRHCCKIPPLRPHLLHLISAVHSLILVLLSAIMAIGCFLATYFQMPDPHWIICFPANSTLSRGPLFFWAYIFYLSKILEFVDTILIILSGNIRRLSFLHVYHHAVTVVLCYLCLHTPQSLLPVGIVTNASVHVVMYSYYLLCALGRRPTWKRWVTNVQIVQFLFGFVMAGVMLYYHLTGLGCSGFWTWCIGVMFNASLLALFLDFHTKNYGRVRKGNKDP